MMNNYKPITNLGGYSSPSSYRKEERTGLNPVPSPLTLSKGGQRHAETISGLSDSAIGGGL